METVYNSELFKRYGVLRKDVEAVNSRNNVLYRYACRRFWEDKQQIHAEAFDDLEDKNRVTESRYINTPIELKWFCYFRQEFGFGGRVQFSRV